VDRARWLGGLNVLSVPLDNAKELIAGSAISSAVVLEFVIRTRGAASGRASNATAGTLTGG
jgi:hypothetical protein